MRRLAIVVLLATTPAWADDDEDEKPTAVELASSGTHVRLTARFAFKVTGPDIELGAHMFRTPRQSVVTSGLAIVDGVRHRLRLEKAETADRSFDALTAKPGDGVERGWAFWITGAVGAVTVNMLAPKPANVVLELVLDAPTCFHNDRRYVELPASWWQRVPAAQRGPTDLLDLDTKTACLADIADTASSTRLVSIASDQLVKEPAGPRRMGAIAGRLQLGTTHFARVELDASRILSEVPRDLHTAIIIDHSRSMAADELESQRALVAAYLRAAPTSSVQVISYARKAEPLLPSWTVASRAAPVLDRAIRALPPRNGSNLDEALREAATWLAGVKGTKRIVLFSDERLATRLETQAADLGTLIAKGTLVHVVRPTGEGLGLFRRDSLLTPFAAATEGIEVVGGGDAQGVVNATMLLRPTSVDELAITGWDTTEKFSDPLDCDISLREGYSCVWWGEGNGAAGPITIKGKLWNTSFKRVINPDASQARTLARMLSVMRLLDESLQELVDKVAFAVNPSWSLFAHWGGTGGYEDLGGFGHIGLGSFGTSGHDIGIGTFHPPRGIPQLDLADQLRPAIASCTSGDTRLEVFVETTLDEIVSVAVAVKPFNAALHTCLVEAVWEATLRIPSAPPHATARVAFGNKP